MFTCYSRPKRTAYWIWSYENGREILAELRTRFPNPSITILGPRLIIHYAITTYKANVGDYLVQEQNHYDFDMLRVYTPEEFRKKYIAEL